MQATTSRERNWMQAKLLPFMVVRIGEVERKRSEVLKMGSGARTVHASKGRGSRPSSSNAAPCSKSQVVRGWTSRVRSRTAALGGRRP